MWYDNRMGRASAGVLSVVLALAVAAAAATATAAPAANIAGTTYVDKGGGYAITIPKTWQLVPRTVAQVNALVARLKKKGPTAELAAFYKQLIASPEAKKQLSVYRFQAFAWPDSEAEPVPIEVSVGIVTGKKAYTAKDLPAVGAVFANAFAANKGSKVTVPKTVKLPTGQAELIVAEIPLGQGVENGVELYLIPRGKLLYELSFQIDASGLASAKLFTSIAEEFRFTS
jgi:hypothetical protein